ncbi:MAG TPA: Ku protein [Gemmatimonadaceae bacterium]|nr:Ku protein [Gemmatimonadaceae bacterium]
MAAIWKGAISFGLVNIPIELRTAVRSDNDGISFRQLHEKDLSPIHMDRICNLEEKAIPYSEIVKGYEYAKGKFVVITDEEIKAAQPQSSKAIDIQDFVQESEIDPRYFDTPYFCVPQKGGERAYALLRETIRNTKMVGIGKFALRNRESLAAIKVIGDAIVLEMMRFGTELINPEEFTFPSSKDVKPQELKMAEQLVAQFATTFDGSKYTDDYRAYIMRLIDDKLKGKEISTEEAEEPEGTPVLDLMARLRESLEQGRKKGGAAGEEGAEEGEEKEAEAPAAEAEEEAPKKAAKKASRSKSKKTA